MVISSMSFNGLTMISGGLFVLSFVDERWYCEGEFHVKGKVCRRRRRAVECIDRLMWAGSLWERYLEFKTTNTPGWIKLIKKFALSCPEAVAAADKIS